MSRLPGMTSPSALLFAFLLSTNLALTQITVSDVSPDFPFGVSRGYLDGRIPGIVIDPSNNSILYATGEWSGVWKSVDAAHTWKQASNGLRNGITQETAYPNLAIDHANPQRLLYASVSKDGRIQGCQGCRFGGLWITTNAASNWTHVSLCATTNQPDNIASVVFSTGRPFVATDCGLWSTSDPNLLKGWTKSPLPRGVSAGNSILAPDGANQKLVACFGGGSRVYRSLDLGQTWDAGIDLGGTCLGLAMDPIQETTVAIFQTSTRDVALVDYSTRKATSLNFASVAQNGSGRPGIWTAPRPASLIHAPGTSYDVFAADSFYFYRYAGDNKWTTNFPLHADTWWMAFPSAYDGVKNCASYAANDGGVYANPTGTCKFDSWVGASSGLHVAWGNQISGLSAARFSKLSQSYSGIETWCTSSHGGQPCPILFLPTTDDDTFMQELGTQGENSPFVRWNSLQDGLGDAGEALIDPLQPNLILGIRNGHYNLVATRPGQVPAPNNGFIQTVTQPSDFNSALDVPSHQGIRLILTMPNETPQPNGDLLGIRSESSGDFIARNLSAALGDKKAQSSWFDVAPSAHFGSGQLAGIYPSGGHNGTTIYALTSNKTGVNYNGTPFRPGQIYKAKTQGTGGGIVQWQPASGSGNKSLVTGYSAFVNPYDPNEMWAVDLGSSPSAIKVTRDGGQSWSLVQGLKDIATDNGEFDFACGPDPWGNGPSKYGDKEIFGNECPLTDMVFPLDQPNVRFATLYPGGLAFSSDRGNTWLRLNVTNANSAQPIELPQSGFYDPTVNSAGNSSFYLALEGKGIKRIDAPFADWAVPPRSFQGLDKAQYIFVLGSDGNLWREQPPFGTLPPQFREKVDGNVVKFEALDHVTAADTAFVLGSDGKLWLEKSPQWNGSSRILVDSGVKSFQDLGLNLPGSADVLVLKKDGKLWLEGAPVSGSPRMLDANVTAFQGIAPGNPPLLFTLGSDHNLWVSSSAACASGGNVPAGCRHVDGNVSSFQALSGLAAFVLGLDGNLWLEQSPSWNGPSRVKIDGNVGAFQAIDQNSVFVLGSDGKLWLERAPTWNGASRQYIDANARTFQALDLQTVLVLATDANLWLERSPSWSGNGRQLVDGNVALYPPQF